MQNQDRSPTILHYAISEVGDNWILSCESIPIDCFDDIAAAQGAAATYIAAAKLRGDCPLLEINDAETAEA